jgi:hypothetical protein
MAIWTIISIQINEIDLSLIALSKFIEANG